MDEPLRAHHGSDKYDFMEVEAPEGVNPPAPFMARFAEPCPDCRANVFFRAVSDDGIWLDRAGYQWRVSIAHELDCPRLRATESHDA